MHPSPGGSGHDGFAFGVGGVTCVTASAYIRGGSGSVEMEIEVVAGAGSVDVEVLVYVYSSARSRLVGGVYISRRCFSKCSILPSRCL